MKTVIYARKSSESEDRQVQSLDDQLNALRILAKREGIRVDEEFVEARSAKEPHTRPEFARLTEAIQSGKICRILTWSMNRLSRNLVDGGLVAHLLQTGKIEAIHTVDRIYRPEDNALLLSIENGMATSFIQDLRKNVVRGMDSKASKGWQPGRVPIGYVNNPFTREVDSDPTRFPLLRKAWDLMLTGGYTPSEMFYEMERLGLSSQSRRQTMRPLSKSMVYSMFSNPFYKGLFSYKGRLVQGKHIPLVTEAEFDAVQRILGRHIDRRKRKHVYAFSGLLKCGKCGCQIVADTRTKTYAGTNRTVSYTYYHCTNGRGGCTKQGITTETLAGQFARAVAKIVIPQSFAEWALEEAMHQSEHELIAMATSASAIDARVCEKQKGLSKLLEMRLNEELSAEEYKAEKLRHEEEIANLVERRKTLLTQEQCILKMIEENLKLAAEAEGFDDQEEVHRRGFILSLGSTHYLTQGILRISLHPILRVIAGFGPLRNGSLSPKRGDILSANSAWYSLIRDIRNVARMELGE